MQFSLLKSKRKNLTSKLMKTKTKGLNKKRMKNTPSDPKSSIQGRSIESRDLNEDEQQQLTNVQDEEGLDESTQYSNSEQDDDRASNRLESNIDREKDRERISEEGDELEK